MVHRPFFQSVRLFCRPNSNRNKLRLPQWPPNLKWTPTFSTFQTTAAAQPCWEALLEKALQGRDLWQVFLELSRGKTPLHMPITNNTLTSPIGMDLTTFLASLNFILKERFLFTDFIQKGNKVVTMC